MSGQTVGREKNSDEPPTGWVGRPYFHPDDPTNELIGNSSQINVLHVTIILFEERYKI